MITHFYKFLALSVLFYGCQSQNTPVDDEGSATLAEESSSDAALGNGNSIGISGDTGSNESQGSVSEGTSLAITPIGNSDTPQQHLNDSLFQACRRFTAGTIDEMRRLLDLGASPDARNERLTCLAAAASNGDVDKVRLLVERGADVNLGTPKPLSFAQISHNEEIINLLKEAGATEL